MSKIGLLIIATNKYSRFLDNLITSADEFFLKGFDVTYFIYTDQNNLNLETQRNVKIIPIKHRPWPWMTLGRYKIFNDSKLKLMEMDYLFYCDADMKFVGSIEREILSARVATQHPGYVGKRGTPETRSESLACVYPHENMQYFAGGFNGGAKSEFLKMSRKLSYNIQIDNDNDIIAVWHDESHMNRYFIDNPPTKILDPGYCWAECHKPPFHPRIIALDKDHKSIRT